MESDPRTRDPKPDPCRGKRGALERPAPRPPSRVERDALLHLRARHEADEFPCQIGLARKPADPQLPAAESGNALPSWKRRQPRHAHLADNARPLGVIGDLPRIRPVAVKDGSSLGKQRKRLGLLIGEHATVRDLPDDPIANELDGLDGLGPGKGPPEPLPL